MKAVGPSDSRPALIGVAMLVVSWCLSSCNLLSVAHPYIHFLY